MFLVFFLTFNVIGSTLSDWLSLGIDKLTDLADKGLTAYGINPVVHSLIIDGVFAGVGSVLSFLPIIVTLFFFPFHTGGHGLHGTSGIRNGQAS